MHFLCPVPSGPKYHTLQKVFFTDAGYPIKKASPESYMSQTKDHARPLNLRAALFSSEYTARL